MASVLEASSHSYLGDQLRDTRARSNVSVDLNKTYRILLIPLADIVLFPGETIPLRIHNPNMVQNIQRIVEETESNESLGATDGTCDFIGVVNNPRLDQYRTVLCRFGTTIDVRSISIPRKRDAIVNNENETLTRHEELVLTAKGKLRFQIINVHHSNQSIIFACAKLLPDAKVTSAHHSAELYAFPKWVYEVNSPATLARRAYQMVEKSIFWKEESSRMLQRWGLLRNLPGAAQQEESGDDDSGALHDSLLRSGSAKRARSAESKSNILTGTSFSSVGMVDASRQTGRDNTPAGVRRWDSYYAQLYGAEVDPVGFSYFLAANLPISNECLQSLLEAQDVVDRLRLCIKYLEEGSGKVLACGVCRLPLAAKQEVFTVPGAEGVTGAYVNPHGAVHQTITVRRLLNERSVALDGRPCARDSWFPGYAWTIASCERCFNHLGWRFTIVSPRRTVSAGATSAATLVSSSGAADISTTTTAAATTAATARAAELVMHQDRVAEIMALVFGARQREQVQEQQVTQDVSGRGSGGNNVDDASRINVSMNLGSASSDYRGDSEDSDSYYEASQGSSGSDNYPEEMTEESSGSSDVDEEDVQQIAMEAGSSAQQRVPASENSHAQLVVTEENTTNDAGNFLESNQSLALEFWGLRRSSLIEV